VRGASRGPHVESLWIVESLASRHVRLLGHLKKVSHAI
jgi:hypothetical protein